MDSTDVPHIRVSRSAEATACAAAAEVVTITHHAIERSGRASIALPGGTTPELLYRQLAAAGRDAVPWDLVTFAFGDERMVPVDTPESNHGLAERELFIPMAISPSQVMAVDTSAGDAAAARYETALHHRFGPAMPRFDLVLLGIGADGHTASLFPGNTDHPAPLGWVTRVVAPPGYAPRARVSLTLDLINNARAVIFLATGERKRDAVGAALHPDTGSPSPAALVRPRGRLAWFVDAAAAP